MELRRLSLHDVHEATRAHEELAREGFEFLHGYQPDIDWLDFLDRTERLRQGIGLSEAWVPETFLVAEVGGRIVGRVSIRHHLNPSLHLAGGHIGYSVRPRFRRNGFAGQILELALVEARNLGIREALLTCDAGNVASRRVIENHGGVPDALNSLDTLTTFKLRYWITT
ncbi:GNAT family N-acetyltransferase [Arthrobacter sp. D1-29]